MNLKENGCTLNAAKQESFITGCKDTSIQNNFKAATSAGNWLDREVSFYHRYYDTTGKALTLRQILLSEFIHCFPTIQALKALDRQDPDYDKRKKDLKKNLSAFALNLLESRTGKVLGYSHLLQLDFDYEQIKSFDIDELMQAIYDLPFVAFCGRSCSGDGFYALAMIAEPERLKDYAEHCFNVLDKHHIPVDKSKGRNYNDLRYVSYDCRMMIKPDPQPLKIKRFNTPKVQVKNTSTFNPQFTSTTTDGRIIKGLREITTAPKGQRWDTVRRVSYTLGGIPGTTVEQIIDVIEHSSQFAGYEDHCKKCAIDSFEAGRKNPFL